MSTTQPTQLDQQLAKARSEDRLSFLPFLVVGDPNPGDFLRMAKAMVEAGADALELGLPYSDPPADGPVVQAADIRALEAGITTAKALELIKQVHTQHNIPISLLVYYNLVLQTGVDEFFRQARDAGIDAVLVADVPFELCPPIFEIAKEHGVSPVCLASALTTVERAQMINDLGEGYIYAAARVGITGVQSNVAASALTGLVSRLKEVNVKLPIIAGFGLSQPEHIQAVREAGADGFIVGSALIRNMASHLDNFELALETTQNLARQLAAAARVKA